MSTGVRVPYREARAVADALVSTFAPACVRLEIAGSIRRGAETAGDVELVAIPRITPRMEPDGLWGNRTVEVSELDEAVDRAVGDGMLTRSSGGERYAKLVHVESGLQLDLFMVRPPAQFGVIHLIRTGPGDYSQRFVTDVRRRGYHVAEGALHGGAVGLSCPKACTVVTTPEERDVYAVTGSPWLNPEDRR